MPLDATFWVASCTKLLSAIAALQCVERGQFLLDEDVVRLLPELKDIDILTGFEEGTEKPIYSKPMKKITLRYFCPNSFVIFKRSADFLLVFSFPRGYLAIRGPTQVYLRL